jgi:hypothetical protein
MGIYTQAQYLCNIAYKKIVTKVRNFEVMPEKFNVEKIYFSTLFFNKT